VVLDSNLTIKTASMAAFEPMRSISQVCKPFLGSLKGEYVVKPVSGMEFVWPRVLLLTVFDLDMPAKTHTLALSFHLHFSWSIGRAFVFPVCLSHSFRGRMSSHVEGNVWESL
jgi:hypothetical protein